jgi:hypothetical protein
MDHHKHREGTVQGCLECTALAYEPSWYASLLSFVERSFGRSVADENKAART